MFPGFIRFKDLGHSCSAAANQCLVHHAFTLVLFSHGERHLEWRLTFIVRDRYLEEVVPFGKLYIFRVSRVSTAIYISIVEDFNYAVASLLNIYFLYSAINNLKF
jgi:hypothetical protein